MAAGYIRIWIVACCAAAPLGMRFMSGDKDVLPRFGGPPAALTSAFANITGQSPAVGGAGRPPQTPAKEAIFFEYRISSMATLVQVKRFESKAAGLLKTHPWVTDHTLKLQSGKSTVRILALSQSIRCYKFVIRYDASTKKNFVRQDVALMLVKESEAMGTNFKIKLMGQRKDAQAKQGSLAFLESDCQTKEPAEIPRSGWLSRLSLIKGHPTPLRIPYSCDVENCDVGGCAREKDGTTMVRVEPAGNEFIRSNPAWGGVHVTMTSFNKYEDPIGMFEKMRATFGADFAVPWYPRVPTVKKKQCNGENTSRLDFDSELLELIAGRLTEAGFKGKSAGHRHISIEADAEFQWIVDAISTEGRTKWNLALVGVEGGEVVKLATMPLKARHLATRVQKDKETALAAQAKKAAPTSEKSDDECKKCCFKYSWEKAKAANDNVAAKEYLNARCADGGTYLPPRGVKLDDNGPKVTAKSKDACTKCCFRYAWQQATDAKDEAAAERYLNARCSAGGSFLPPPGLQIGDGK